MQVVVVVRDDDLSIGKTRNPGRALVSRGVRFVDQLLGSKRVEPLCHRSAPHQDLRTEESA
jgi:hypothetical protein